MFSELTTPTRHARAEPEDILRRHPRAGVLRPAFSVVRDRQRLKAIVLVVRGTHSLKVPPPSSSSLVSRTTSSPSKILVPQDMFTCLTSAVKPHHMTGSSGVVLGYSHFGMLAAARWILKVSNRCQLQATLPQAVEQARG